MDRGVDGAGAAHVCRREAVGRDAPRLGVDRRTPGPLVVVVVFASEARRGRDAREGHVDLDGRLGAAPGRPGLRGPTRDTIPNPPRVQRASQLETTRRCASRIIASRTGDETQSTRR